MSATDYTSTDAINNKAFIPDIFGIYLNTDGTIYKILSNIEGTKLKKNSLGTFIFTLKKIVIHNQMVLVLKIPNPFLKILNRAT